MPDFSGGRFGPLRFASVTAAAASVTAAAASAISAAASAIAAAASAAAPPFCQTFNSSLYSKHFIPIIWPVGRIALEPGYRWVLESFNLGYSQSSSPRLSYIPIVVR